LRKAATHCPADDISLYHYPVCAGLGERQVGAAIRVLAEQMGSFLYYAATI
jgi:hypothetical protein